MSNTPKNVIDMRRKDRELTDLDSVFEIIEHCHVLHLGMVDDGKPYVVALNFGYEREGDSLILYVHCATEGRKLDILRNNPAVFFQMDCASELVPGSTERPCAFSWKYESVMGSGNVEFIDDVEKKSYALNKIIQHVGGTDGNLQFPETSLIHTCVLCIQSNDFTGKQHL